MRVSRAAAELPSFETAHTETPTPRNPLGAKGIGEAGTTGAIPAVQNAVVDALTDLGVRHLDMPTTPERIWRAIADAPEGGDREGCMERPDMKGLIAAIVTPMREDFSVDETSLRRYVRWLSEQGVAGLAVNVDTSERPHLSAEERVRVIEIVSEEVGDRTLIVAGLAGSFTAQSLPSPRTQRAPALGLCSSSRSPSTRGAARPRDPDPLPPGRARGVRPP